jgi:hypothetical protein
MAILKRRTVTLWDIERAARRFMMAVAAAAAMVGLSCHAGLISADANYERQAWYLMTEHDGFMVTTRFDNEAACRPLASPTAACSSGASLMDRPLATPRP